MQVAAQFLKEHGIRPSIQRVAIMKYLMEHHTHPTVDMIYNDLLPSIPTLSRSTVYNTVELLQDKKAIVALTIDSRNVHYDGTRHPHAHFICRCCGAIKDIPISADLSAEMSAEGDKIERVELSYSGICANCQKQ